MKNVFLVYDDCCFYEIVILNYFMKFTGQDVVICSLNGSAITCIEGYSVNVDMALKDVEIDNIKSLIIPGGHIKTICNEEVYELIRDLVKKEIIVAAICAGVDVLENTGVLKDTKSTHSEDTDIYNDKKVITARANAYVDFAIEVAKELNLFKDEADLKETLDFWKFHKRVQWELMKNLIRGNEYGFISYRYAKVNNKWKFI